MLENIHGWDHRMKIAAIVFARMMSSRLPGKVLASFCDRSILNHVLWRTSKIPEVTDIVLAIPSGKENDVICWNADRRIGDRLKVFRGSESDVLSRFVGASQLVNADIVLRITADNPLLDPPLAFETIQMVKGEWADYATITGLPMGTQVEAMSAKALYRLAEMPDLDAYDREHATHGFYKYREQFTLKLHPAPRYLTRPDYRLTVDEMNDLALVSEVFCACGRDCDLEKAIKYLDDNPSVLNKNRDIVQRTRIGEVNTP